MAKKRDCIFLVLFILGLILSMGCTEAEPPQKLEIGANPDLSAHSKEFRKEVIKVTDGVYVAIGFGLANSVLLEGRRDFVKIAGTLYGCDLFGASLGALTTGMLLIPLFGIPGGLRVVALLNFLTILLLVWGLRGREKSPAGGVLRG